MLLLVLLHFVRLFRSITSNVSLSASGSSLSITLCIFSSSSIKYFLLCNLPAVSQIITSISFSFANLIPSKTTDAGSDFSSLFIISHLARFAQISSCSTAAALNVSAATTNTFFPFSLNLFAIFPIDVVFPNSVYSYNKHY